MMTIFRKILDFKNIGKKQKPTYKHLDRLPEQADRIQRDLKSALDVIKENKQNAKSIAKLLIHQAELRLINLEGTLNE